MKLPSFYLAAVAGLWQQPLSTEEEPITSTIRVHVTKTVPGIQTTLYAKLVGTSTVFMDHLPASLTPISTEIAQVMPTTSMVASTHTPGFEAYVQPLTHLELRSANVTMTRHVKITRTVESVEATVFATSAGTSILTLPNPSESTVETTLQVVAISSAPAATAHSTVANLDIVTASSTPSTTSTPGFLELRSDGDTTSTMKIHITMTVANSQSTIYQMVGTSSTSSMTSVPSSIIAIASSQAARASQSAATEGDDATSTTSTITTSSVTTTTSQQDTKSTQTELLPTSSESDIIIPVITTKQTSNTQNIHLNTASETSSSPSSSESTSTTQISDYTISPLSSSIAPIPTTSALPSTSFVRSNEYALPSKTTYLSKSSASAAELAADNAAGASGTDPGSFKLSKAGFAAIISVVCIGVGLGIIFLILFVIAKRRQWKIRASIARASRNFTARFKPGTQRLNEKNQQQPGLPTVEPTSAFNVRNPMNAHRNNNNNNNQGFANIDATMQSYRGVQSVRGAPSVRGSHGVRNNNQTMSGARGPPSVRNNQHNMSGARGPEVWRREMGREGEAGVDRIKPLLRVDTRLAREMEDGRLGGAGGGRLQREKGTWGHLLAGMRAMGA